ncbi:MAG: hypothetical protein OEL57_08270 [Trichlorobacter sp.]|uniref:hypothetical protein n=1 Tax=Trichlorobacter sp. TaxID=2911007 RepID=UPI002564AC14|nr:hypothetical protein [Trichlorobacter sp.]MDK9717888.1 hypothetical protein [Trichlorobacter sp.]
MSIFKMILSFAPWIAFLIISGPTMFRLKLGIIVAAILVIVMGVTKLHRGVILWAGVLFFIYALISVVWLNNMWTVRHMGILANGTLALGAWLTVLLKQPFTLDYAKEHTDPSLWDSPIFLKTNYVITSAWGVVFIIGVLNAWLKMQHLAVPHWVFEVAQYSFMLGAMFFTNWYTAYVKRQRGSEPGLA